MWRSVLLLTLVGFGLLGHWSKTAQATVAKGLSLTELTLASHAAAVGSAAERECRWEVVGGQKRIVTYTRLAVTRRVFGLEQNVTEVTVRTLGGRIGDLGQIVHGEARLQRDKPALVFLRSVGDTGYRVTAMAQGHFPLAADATGVLRVQSRIRGARLLGGPLAALRLVGLDLDTAIEQILKARADG
jgi:hypothetical protein